MTKIYDANDTYDITFLDGNAARLTQNNINELVVEEDSITLNNIKGDIDMLNDYKNDMMKYISDFKTGDNIEAHETILKLAESLIDFNFHLDEIQKVIVRR